MSPHAPTWVVAAVLVGFAGVATALSGEPLSAADDHARIMARLGIDALRAGADGDPASPNAANYDESKASGNLASLPALLTTDAGDRVDTADAWWTRRRPEIVEHFDREIYGRVPAVVPAVSWQSGEPIAGKLGDVPVLTHAVTGRAGGDARPDLAIEIALEVTVPEEAGGAVPVVLQLTFGPEFMAMLRERFTEGQLRAFRGTGPDWQEQVAARGWASAKLVATSVQADSGDGLQAGIIGLANRGRPRELDDWGALRAWAWGLSRALDYLETVDAVDATRVAIQGHSRYGKAALVAMAYDRRFAAVFVSSSGEGGAKLWRRNFGEQIGNIAGAGEYHWVAGNFLKYAGPLDANDLPVDAHALIALCAPRPVFVSSGYDGDQWTDPRGMFLATAFAAPVYELLGARGPGSDEYPPVGTALTDGELAWRQHGLGHTPGPNWPHFLDFAARYFER
jgi:hypothetical protein